MDSIMESEDYCVYVLDKDGNIVMPTRRFGKVRRMVKDGLAKIVCKRKDRFTIQLLYEPKTHEVDEATIESVRKIMNK